MTEEGSAPAAGRSIVVGVDGSRPSREALTWAAHQAALTRSPLTVVTAWEFPTSFGWAPPWPQDYDPQAEAERMLERVVGEVLGSRPGVEVTRVAVQGHPALVLTEMSKSSSTVVVGSRGHGEFTGMLLGSVSEFLATHAHCPVVVVR
jgi:nucleotide-binding universal stress UspA family protein